jgi:hypothetical protein
MLSGLADKARYQSCLASTVFEPLGLRPELPGDDAKLKVVPDPAKVDQVVLPDPKRPASDVDG